MKIVLLHRVLNQSVPTSLDDMSIIRYQIRDIGIFSLCKIMMVNKTSTISKKSFRFEIKNLNHHDNHKWFMAYMTFYISLYLHKLYVGWKIVTF